MTSFSNPGGLSQEVINAARSRLASRRSFFSGSLVTRNDTRAVNWLDLPSFKALKENRPNTKAPGCRDKISLASFLDSVNTASVKHSPLVNANGSVKATIDVFGRPERAVPPPDGRKQRSRRAIQQLTDSPAKSSMATTPSGIELAGRGNSPAPKIPGLASISGKSTTQLPKLLRHQQMTSMGVQTVQLLVRSQHSVGKPGNDQQCANGIPLLHKGSAYEDSKPDVLSNNDDAAEELIEACVSPKVKDSLRGGLQQATKEKELKRQKLRGTFYGTAQPPAALRAVRTVDDESASDLESFIDSDDEGEEGSTGCGERNWRSALKEALQGYDASRFAATDALPDRRMQATYAEIAAEEARAGRIGQAIDRREAAREAAEKQERKKRREIAEMLGIKYSEKAECDDSSDSDDEDDEENASKRRKTSIHAFLASY